MVESQVRIRPAEREDVPTVVLISRTSVTDEEVSGFGVPVTESRAEEVDRILSSWIGNGRAGAQELLVAERDGLVVGCVKIEERGDDLELVDIDVLRPMQGQGIGKSLVTYVEELARERRKRAVTLGTSRNSAGVAWMSLPWWTSIGYSVTHEEENDWTRSIAPGVREIRMRKGISHPD